MYMMILLLKITLLIILAVSGALLGLLGYLFLVYKRVDFDILPVLDGVSGNNYEVLNIDGIPLLVYNGLPYPTFFDSTGRERFSLNGRWEMKMDPDDIGIEQEWFIPGGSDGNWLETTVPSTFNTVDSRYRDYTGITWFKKVFHSPAFTPQKGYIRICFEGVLLRSTVWLNGQKLGFREGGYTPFYFDITDFLKPEENSLVIRTDNRLRYHTLPPRIGVFHKPGWHTYGGIYRDVYYEMVPLTNICKVDVRFIPENPGRASVAVITQARSAGIRAEIRCSVVTPGKERLSTEPVACTHDREFMNHTFTAQLPGTETWSPDNPALYRVTIFLKSEGSTDTVSLATGFREIAVTRDSMLLNGKEIFLKGICKHEDDPVHGHTQTGETITRDLKQIRDMNANYIRLVHYPHNTKELTAARDMGFLLSEEIPFYQAGTGVINWFAVSRKISEFPFLTFGPKQMNNTTLLKNAQRELIEMIERDRNNPAIILWGLGNETYTLGSSGSRPYRWLAATARVLDPTRPTTMADLTYNARAFDRKRSAGRYVDIPSFNLYSGWYYGRIEDISRQLELARSLSPDKPLLISEFGAGAVLGRSDENGVWQVGDIIKGKTFSEEYQAGLLEKYVTAAIDAGYIAGVSPWVHADFLCMEFPSNPVPNCNLKGVVSTNREPKKGYHLLKELYGKRPAR